MAAADPLFFRVFSSSSKTAGSTLIVLSPLWSEKTLCFYFLIS
jgi:hypothetical protein